MKPHYRRGLKNWEEKKKHQFNSIIQTRFFVKGDGKIPSYFKTTWKPQTPKKFQLPKRIRFPRSISQRIRENVPSEIPPLKSHWKMARLIVYSIPKHPTEDSTLNNWGNVQQDFPGVAPPTAKQLHHVVFLLGRNFEVWRFFSSKKSALTALQIDTSARQILHREHTQWASAAPLTRNKKKTSCPVSSISSSPWRSIPPEDPERFRKKLLTIAKVQKPQSHIKWVPRHWVTPHQQHCPTSFRDRSPCAARLQAASAECGRNAGCFGDLGQSQYEPVFSSEKLSFFSGVWN